MAAPEAAVSLVMIRYDEERSLRITLPQPAEAVAFRHVLPGVLPRRANPVVAVCLTRALVRTERLCAPAPSGLALDVFEGREVLLEQLQAAFGDTEVLAGEMVGDPQRVEQLEADPLFLVEGADVLRVEDDLDGERVGVERGLLARLVRVDQPRLVQALGLVEGDVLPPANRGKDARHRLPLFRRQQEKRVVVQIAQMVQEQWRKELGINLSIQGVEGKIRAIRDDPRRPRPRSFGFDLST